MKKQRSLESRLGARNKKISKRSKERPRYLVYRAPTPLRINLDDAFTPVLAYGRPKSYSCHEDDDYDCNRLPGAVGYRLLKLIPYPTNIDDS